MLLCNYPLQSIYFRPRYRFTQRAQMSCDTVKMDEVGMAGFPTQRRMLPIEMLTRVFLFLRPRDLKAVMLVCKRWNEAGSVPKLWSWVVLKLKHSSHDEHEGSGQQGGFETTRSKRMEWCKEMRSRVLEADNHALTSRLKEMQEQLEGQALQNRADKQTCRHADMQDLFLKMISLPRLAAAREIIIESFSVNDEVKLTLLCKALSRPGLKKLGMHGGDVRTMEPQLLASFLTKVEELDLSDVLMSTEQRSVFLSALKEANNIKRFSWRDDKRSQRLGLYTYVCLPNAVKKVEKLTLDIPRYGAQMLFKALKGEDASVKSISLVNDDARRIRHGSLSETVPDLGRWKLTLEQWTAICNAIKSGSKLKKLAIPGEVECSVFSGVLHQLPELDLRNAFLKAVESETIMLYIAMSPGKLKRVFLQGNYLEHVDATAIARMATKLSELDLGSTSLKAVQAETIMLYVAKNPGKLKKVILQGNDLEHVDAGAIARMATKIESVNIAKTELSTKQAEEIFEAIADSPGVLKNLNMDSNDLREVDPKVMADAVNKLEKVCFSDMPLLTQRQMRMILTQALEKGTALKELSISPERRAFSVFHENQNQNMYTKLFPVKE